jgi:hypothetical protein
MRKRIPVIGFLTVCVAVLFAADEQRPLNIKPGEWQVQYDVKYTGLPPQYQAMVDQMTAQQKSAMGLSTPETSKLCVKAADLDKPWSQDNCRWTILKPTASNIEAHSSSCQHGSRGANSDMDMNIKIHALDSEHVRATLHGTAMMQDSQVTIDGSYLGKWLGSTCSPKD